MVSAPWRLMQHPTLSYRICLCSWHTPFTWHVAKTCFRLDRHFLGLANGSDSLISSPSGPSLQARAADGAFTSIANCSACTWACCSLVPAQGVDIEQGAPTPARALLG